MIILENNKIYTLVSDIYTTRAYTAINKTIAAHTRFKESKGRGMINQILLKSNSQAYTFKALIDNEIAYDFTYAFFLANTADISNISAINVKIKLKKVFIKIKRDYIKKK